MIKKLYKMNNIEAFWMLLITKIGIFRDEKLMAFCCQFFYCESFVNIFYRKHIKNTIKIVNN